MATVDDSRCEAGDFPRFAACGDRALTVEFGTTVDEAINQRVMALAERLSVNPPNGLEEFIPTYRSVTLVYDPVQTNAEELVSAITKRLINLEVTADTLPCVIIPVLYAGPACLDLDEIAAAKNMSVDEVIHLHVSAHYRVYMIGFQPGFAYLGGLSTALHMPRKSVPRQSVPGGSLGIGGSQASISSCAGPSAWYFLGQTPLRLFDKDRSQPFLLSPGQEVRLRNIEEDEFTDLERRVAQGEMCLEEEERDL